MGINLDINTIINALIHYGSILALAMFLLVFATQIIVEVFKGLFPKLPTAVLVFVISIVITVLTLVVAAAALEITVMWYYAVGAVVLGVFVAHAAMNGFDKYKELFERFKTFKGQ